MEDKKTEVNAQNGHLDSVRQRLQNTSLAAKHRIAAMWSSKARIEGRKLLPLLLLLDDEYDRVYKQERIRKGFEAASLMAYQRVFSIIYSV